jgi:hypothetical protein
VHPQAWSAGEGQQRPDGALAALTAEGSTVVTLWVLTAMTAPHASTPGTAGSSTGHMVVELDAVTLSKVRYKRTLGPESPPSVL